MAVHDRIVRLSAASAVARAAIGAAVILGGVGAGLIGAARAGDRLASDYSVGPDAVPPGAPRKVDQATAAKAGAKAGTRSGNTSGTTSRTTSRTTSAPSSAPDPATPLTGGTRASVPRREPRRAATADNDVYGCHPNEDLACTVVRETAAGMTIVTMRPGGAGSPPASWSVVSGTPAGASAYPGGIIYVVPTVPTRPPRFEPGAGQRDGFLTANDAPILD